MNFTQTSEDYGTPRDGTPRDETPLDKLYRLLNLAEKIEILGSPRKEMYGTPRGQTPKSVIECALLENAIDQDKIACCGVSATVECAKSIYRRLLCNTAGVDCSSFKSLIEPKCIKEINKLCVKHILEYIKYKKKSNFLKTHEISEECLFNLELTSFLYDILSQIGDIQQKGRHTTDIDLSSEQERLLYVTLFNKRFNLDELSKLAELSLKPLFRGKTGILNNFLNLVKTIHVSFITFNIIFDTSDNKYKISINGSLPKEISIPTIMLILQYCSAKNIYVTISSELVNFDQFMIPSKTDPTYITNLYAIHAMCISNTNIYISDINNTWGFFHPSIRQNMPALLSKIKDDPHIDLKDPNSKCNFLEMNGVIIIENETDKINILYDLFEIDSLLNEDEKDEINRQIYIQLQQAEQAEQLRLAEQPKQPKKRQKRGGSKSTYRKKKKTIKRRKRRTIKRRTKRRN